MDGEGDNRGRRWSDTWMAGTRGGGDRKRPGLEVSGPEAAKLDAAGAGDGWGRRCLGLEMTRYGDGRGHRWQGPKAAETGGDRAGCSRGRGKSSPGQEIAGVGDGWAWKWPDTGMGGTGGYGNRKQLGLEAAKLDAAGTGDGRGRVGRDRR